MTVTTDGGRVLVVDDDEDILTATRLLLKRQVGEVSTLPNPTGIEARLRRDPPDLILLDMNFGPGESDGAQGLDCLERIIAIDPDAVVVMITAHGGVNTAVEAMKRGAADFVIKPWSNERLLATVRNGLIRRRAMVDTQSLRKKNRELAVVTAAAEQPIIGSSEPMRRVLTMIERTAPTDANVMILGENGTGKELAARELHRQSNRAEEVFMSVDLGSVSESVFESELFGHVKGAFTDARSDRAGRLVTASGGTLFLDEIGNLPLHLQAKLLTVLEQRQVTPVGANAPVPIDVRVVSATNLEQSQLNDPSVFRQDLLFRLNTVELRLPPLRDRPDDVPALVGHYLSMFERKYGRDGKEVPGAVMDALKRHEWPGNIRALRHAVERAVILSSADRYGLDDFSLSPDGSTEPEPSVDGSVVEPPEAQELNLERLEKAAIASALRKHRYNISHAAKELGITRAALYRRMEKHGL
ncbi:MAG: sigma-54 dependent transcriptional regulator [Myxococcota bacterium]